MSEGPELFDQDDVTTIGFTAFNVAWVTLQEHNAVGVRATRAS